jgi:hypothetical protein
MRRSEIVLFLSNPFKPSEIGSILSKSFVLLASPTGFEPVLSP